MDIMDTIDKIGETLTSASKDIAKKAKGLVDVNTVKSAMSDQKRVIAKAYERIGEQYYKEHVDAGSYDYEVEFEIIGEATAKLKELSEQLRALRKVDVCTECGATVSTDAVFCSKCGVKLQKEQPVTKESVDEDEAGDCEPAVDEPDQRETEDGDAPEEMKEDEKSEE